jgi:hypothetical protein
LRRDDAVLLDIRGILRVHNLHILEDRGRGVGCEALDDVVLVCDYAALLLVSMCTFLLLGESSATASQAYRFFDGSHGRVHDVLRRVLRVANNDTSERRDGHGGGGEEREGKGEDGKAHIGSLALGETGSLSFCVYLLGI